jgi:hypothetical protein
MGTRYCKYYATVRDYCGTVYATILLYLLQPPLTTSPHPSPPIPTSLHLSPPPHLPTSTHSFEQAEMYSFTNFLGIPLQQDPSGKHYIYILTYILKYLLNPYPYIYTKIPIKPIPIHIY